MTKYSRFFNPPDGQSYFLFGPRGTGKSQYLRDNYPDSLKIDLLKDRELRTYTADPDHLLEILDAHPAVRQVIIDEVQKVPTLLSVVHSAMEEKKDRGIQFILTGSSSRKLKQASVDLLAGRAVLRSMHPLMAAEMGDDFNLEQALELGLLPLVVGSLAPKDTLESYISVYLREEVKSEGLVRNLGAFTRFLEAMAFSHGQVLNLSEVARECQVGRTTAVGYLEILQDLLLGTEVPSFRKSDRKAVVEHGKFYYFDAGVFRSLRPAGPLDRPGLIDTAAFEGLVFQHLRAWLAYRNRGNQLFYWRTRAGNEVDFVIYGKEEFCAIEVKDTARLRTEDFSGLQSFGEDFPEAKRMILHRGSESFVRNGILATNAEQFLRKLDPSRPITA